MGVHRGREVRDVWAWNFDVEFDELLTAASTCGPGGATLALDTEFPGFFIDVPASAGRVPKHQALCENVDNLRPIQVGVAVAREDGSVMGAWCFNLRFDINVDLHTEASVKFLVEAGVDFPRHAREGIEASVIGKRLAASSLVGRAGSRPHWVTFQGMYDLGYLLKLLTNWPMPSDASAFEDTLDAFCPRRCELRESFPRGSLDTLVRDHGVQRVGSAHTAGSDALATLDLFLRRDSPREFKRAKPLSEAVVLEIKRISDPETRGFYDEDASWGYAAEDTSWNMQTGMCYDGSGYSYGSPAQQWTSMCQTVPPPPMQPPTMRAPATPMHSFMRMHDQGLSTQNAGWNPSLDAWVTDVAAANTMAAWAAASQPAGMSMHHHWHHHGSAFVDNRVLI